MIVPCARAPSVGGTNVVTPSAHEFNSKSTQDHQNFHSLLKVC